MKNIIITGISGQDGIFLSNHIINNSPRSRILGITRSQEGKGFHSKLKNLNSKYEGDILLSTTNLDNPDSVYSLIKDFNPDYIYNLSGPSSPYESIQNPSKYIQIENIFNNLTNSLIELNNFCNFFQASSSEMFANENAPRLNENSPLSGNSPYAEYKIRNHLKVQNFNEKYDWKIFSGIMFNHESEFRDNNYLLMKIINTAYSISIGNIQDLVVGSTEYVRDWSFAGDMANAIYKIANFGINPTYVIGSGIGHSILDMIKIVFEFFSLDYEKYLRIDSDLLRDGDAQVIVADPKILKDELSWNCELSFRDLIHRCVKQKL